MTQSQRPSGREPEHLWTGQFITAIVVNSLAMIVFYLLMTTMALYAVQRFAASDSVAGLASSMFIIGAIGARLISGRLVITAGPRRVLVWSLVVYIIMSLAYLVAADLLLLLAVRLVHGVAHGLSNTAVTSIPQQLIPRARRGEGTGYYTLSVPLATALGPLLGMTSIERWGYDALFWVSVAASTAAFLVALSLRPQPRQVERPRHSGLGWHGFVSRESLPVASVMLFVGVAASSTITFVHAFSESLDLDGQASTFFAANAVGVLVSRLLAGRLQDRFGDNWVIYPALLTHAVGLLVLSQVTTVSGLVVAAVLSGLGPGSIMPTVQAAAVRLVHPHAIGMAVSTYFLLLDIGTGVGPVILGGLVSAWGYRVMYLAVCVLMLVTCVHYHLVHGRYRGRVHGSG